ncbi:hypothetical protein JT739_12385 [Tepidanaerobacter sp. GT38]|uniref:HlyD family efflux transporter periplasmic adaptor subunit n=1 Tax=Tepidanaerobacter sp. GT38 TaxID=2722793 RepID=UPI001F359445|nr:HlyD family efflux transporter periplasmic adaptor subunit [Tepidanaerobacter sp. GT38]MCG1013380.1 hypothetical protein [Tepidanaerobacter sp. GT38]
MRQHYNKKVVYLRPKKKSLKLPIFIALLFIVILLLYFYKALFMNTYTVINGEISESFSADAIIIKNEIPVLSPVDGKVQLLVKSGERVRVGTPLFIVTTDEKQKQHYQKEMAEIEEKIGTLEDSAGSSLIALNLINKSIENTTEKLKEATESGEFDKVKLLKDELERLTNERKKLLESNEANINLLKKQLNQIQEDLSKIEIVTYASDSGIVSLFVDGFEDILVPNRAEKISHAQLQAVSESASKPAIGKNVRANQPVLKIIDNFSWYIALKPEKTLKEGREYYIKINDDEKIKARLIKINEEGIGFFLVNTDLDSLLDSRKVKVEIILGTYSGAMIPKNAIFTDDGGEKGVYIIERGKRRFKPVEPVIEDEYNVIVEGLKQGDKILLK